MSSGDFPLPGFIASDLVGRNPPVPENDSDLITPEHLEPPAFLYAHCTINGIGIVVNVLVVVVFFRHFRPFSAPILTLLALALADGALLITSSVLAIDENSKTWALPLQQVRSRSTLNALFLQFTVYSVEKDDVYPRESVCPSILPLTLLSVCSVCFLTRSEWHEK